MGGYWPGLGCKTSRAASPVVLGLCRPLAAFAGIWTDWTSVRKVKEGETTNPLFGFLTTEPNAEVGAIHPKAMPVILTTPAEIEAWMTAPAEEALKLQRPLRDLRQHLKEEAAANEVAWRGRRRGKRTSPDRLGRETAGFGQIPRSIHSLL